MAEEQASLLHNVSVQEPLQIADPLPRKAKRRGLDFNFLKYFLRLLRLMFPKLKSCTLFWFIFLLIARGAEEYNVYNTGLVPSIFYEVIDGRDAEGFKSVLWQAAIVILSVVICKSAREWVAGLLYVRWRGLITQGLHKLYFKHKLYYQLSLLEETIDNPDQRMTQDVDRFCLELQNTVPQLVIAPFVIVYYSYKTFDLMGIYGPASIYAFAIIGATLNKFLMGPVVRAVVKQEEREGHFRFHHMQVRVNSEPIALYRGGKVESENAKRRLGELLSTQYRVLNWNLPLNTSINFFDYFGAILSYILISIPVFYLGWYDHLSAVELSSLVSKSSFMSIYLINNFTKLIDLSTNMSDLIGYTHRIGELLLALTKLDKDEFSKRKREESESESCDGDQDDRENSFPEEVDNSDQNDQVALETINLSLSPPQWKHPILKDISFTWKKGCNILITGENGTGKSSLIRVLADLWQPLEGSYKWHQEYGPNGIMVLPQKVYLTSGSLADQIAFPRQAKDSDYTCDNTYQVRMDRTSEALQMTHLLYLRDRLGGNTVPLSLNQSWSDYISPGEAQGLSFARLFFHKPDFAILDEATSSMSETKEELMYRTLKMMGITYISIGHRSTLQQYHDKVIKLSDQCGEWQIRDVPTGSIVL